ncbi:MAG: MYXO-CTERM sorting domain-containing protein, partial [Halobacteriales archaeon]|nr:MYXO-CTERM sorting domain-containing protein [Halobacteriales archaeon]
GQGFVTEYAQPTDQLNVQIFTEVDEDNWETLQVTDYEGRQLDLLDRLVELYRVAPNSGSVGPGAPVTSWQGYEEAIEQAFSSMTAAEQDRIKECGSCVFDQGATFPEGLTSEDLLTTFEDFVVAPMQETQELIDSSPYVTRLYTTMSASEMTLDPSFDYNPDLENVSNVHTAERIIECHTSITQSEAPWRAELPSGLVVRGEPGSNSWPFQPGDDREMPATISVQEVDTSGPGEIVRDNIEDIRVVLDRHNAAIPEVRGGCGCRTAGSAPGGSLLFVLVGMVGLGLRRRVKRTA